MKINVIRKNDHVWLDIDDMYPQKPHQPNTVFKSFAITLKTLGSSLDYSTLMAVSGAAFRFQLHPQWCPSSPHPDCGFNCTQTVLKELGLDESIHNFDLEKTQKNDLEQVVIKNIDAGIPVVASSFETGLIVGYIQNQNDTAVLLREPYSSKGGEPDMVSTRLLIKIPGLLTVFDNVPHYNQDELFLPTLKRAVEIAYHEKINEYYCGFEAFDHWISDLLNEEKINELINEYGIADLCNANAHIYHSLVDARKSAAEYFKDFVDDTGTNQQIHIMNAVALYEEIVKILRNAFPHVLLKWQIKQGQEWRPVMRKEQAETLQTVVELEHKALYEIEQIIKYV